MSCVTWRDCRSLCGLLIGFALLTTTAARADDVDDYVTAQMRKQHIPGLSLAIVREGKVVKSEGYGLASLELGAPATTATVYRLGSLTKQFTAMLTMMEAEAGKLSLDDLLSKYVAQTPPAWSKVTVRSLLNHTSGIKNYTSVSGFPRDTMRTVTPAELVRYVAKYPLDFPPGTRFAYSNTGYFLLGMLLEKVTGKSYASLLDERILTPLHLSSTRLDDAAAIVPNRAGGYSHSAGTVARNAVYIDMSWPFSAGALISNVVDLAKWDAALYTEALVKKSTFDQILIPPTLPGGATSNYGFGWEIGRTRGHRLMEHGGTIPGFASHIVRYVDDKLTIIVLTNDEDANPSAIAHGAAGFYVPELSTAGEKPIEDTEPQIATLLRGIFAKFAAGTGDPSVFTPEMWKLIQPSVQNPAEYKPLGTLRTVDLLERQVVDALDIRTYRYRLTFDSGSLIVQLVIDKAGKISAMRIRPE